MRLAFYTYSYTDRLQMPIEACLQRIAKTGYAGIDVSGTHGDSADPQSVDSGLRRLTRQTAAGLDLRIEAVVTHAVLTDTLMDARQTTLDLHGSVDLAADLGSPVVTFHMGGYPDGSDHQQVWNSTVEAIRAAAEYAGERNLKLAVDGIWPIWIDDSCDLLAKLFDDVASDHFAVNFDPSYLTLMGVDPVDFIHRFHHRIVHAHLKDHRGTYEEWTHLLPGFGDMNYTRVFAALAEVDFSGALAVECFTDMDFEAACDTCHVALTQAAAGAGVHFAK